MSKFNFDKWEAPRHVKARATALCLHIQRTQVLEKHGFLTKEDFRERVYCQDKLDELTGVSETEFA